MRLGEEDAAKPERPDSEIVKDLLCGLGPAHIRRLCDNTFEGGMGFSPRVVGDMTLDMAFMLLANKKHLRSGNARANTLYTAQVAALADAEGNIKGRSGDGKQIKAKVIGKSLAQRIQDGEIAFDADGNPVQPKPKPKPESKANAKPRRRGGA